MNVIDSTLQGWLDNGDFCQCCQRMMPEDEATGAPLNENQKVGDGLGNPVSCVRCIEISRPIVEGYTPT